MDRALQFPKGQLYLLITKDNRALRIDDPVNHNKSRVSTTHPNPQDISQLFFVEKINGDDFQIINALSGLVFDEGWGGEIKLKQGKQHSDQLFCLEKANLPGYQTFYYIKTQKSGKKSLRMEGFLRYGEFDSNEENQLFRLEIVNNNDFINSTTIIVNARSGKVLDVPEATDDKGSKIIQFKKNKRLHQRWSFIRTNRGYQIKNVKSNLFLDISGEARKPGSKVVQWNDIGGSNQLWTIEKGSVSNQWIIRSVHEPSLVLGINDDGVDDGDKLVIVSHNAEWIFEGAFPK